MSENEKNRDRVGRVPAVIALSAIRAVTGRYMRRRPMRLALEREARDLPGGSDGNS